MKQLPDKIDPLIRRLSTESDGETVACVRAISRVLASAGLTFHDLADRLKDQSVPNPYSDPYAYAYAAAAAGARARQERAKRATAEPVIGDYATWLEAVEWLQAEHGTKLREREAEFVQSLIESLPRYMTPTEKQEKWLRDILARFGVS